MNQVSSRSRDHRVASAVLFAFLVTLAALGVVASIVGYAMSTVRGTGTGIAGFAPWVLLVGVTGAVFISPYAETTEAEELGTIRAMSWGVATAGALTAIGVIARDISDLADVGPLQLTIAGTGIATMFVAPFVARAFVTRHVAARVATVMIDPRTIDSGSSPQPMDRYRFLALGAGIVALAIGLIVVLASGPLGHDESVYALKARSWHAGTPTTGFDIYRPIGMPVVGWIVLVFSDSELALRSAGVVLATGAVVAMWFAGRIMFSTGAAWFGTTVFVASASFLRRATEFLNDLAAAGFLIATMLVIWYHFERRPHGWWIVACAPLAAGAYYMRYGSALGLAVISLFAVAVWHRSLLESWKQITSAGLVALILLIPHFIYASDLTGSALGIFRSASTSVGGGGGGIGHYISWLPEHLAGRLGAALIVAGVAYTVAVVVAAVRSDADAYVWQMTRTTLFLTGTAVMLTLALGAFTHGEPRFVFMPIMALLLVGGHAATRIGIRIRQAPRVVISGVLSAIVLLAFSSGVIRMSRTMDGITGSRTVIAESADAVRIDADSRDCFIRSSYVPQMTWYAGCSTYAFREPVPTSPPSYLVVFDKGKRQPTGTDLETEIGTAGGTPIAVVDDAYNKVGTGLAFRYP